MDIFNDTVLFLIITLFAFLLVHTRKVHQLAASLLFITTLAVAHFFEQIYPVLFYQAYAWIRIPVFLIGCMLLMFSLNYHPTGKRLSRAPALLASFIGLLVLICVQIYRQTHLPNVALVFPEWLATQKSTVAVQYAYIIGYELAYATIIVGMTFLLLCLSRQKKWTVVTNFIVEFSWQFLLFIGFVLMLYPYVLGNSLFPLVFITLAIITTWFSLRLWSRLKR